MAGPTKEPMGWRAEVRGPAGVFAIWCATVGIFAWASAVGTPPVEFVNRALDYSMVLTLLLMALYLLAALSAANAPGGPATGTPSASAGPVHADSDQARTDALRRAWIQGLQSDDRAALLNALSDEDRRNAARLFLGLLAPSTPPESGGSGAGGA